MFDTDLKSIWTHLEPFAWLIGTIVAGILVGSLGHLIVWTPVKKFARQIHIILDDQLNLKWRRPSRFVFITFTLFLALPLISSRVPREAFVIIRSIAVILLGAAVLYALIKLAYIAEEVILHHFRVDVKDNLHARQMHTRVKILRRLTTTAIIIIGLGIVLLSFDRFRELGTGLLASAGIVGIVVGLAAQKTLGNILAGIQIAITQPIRLDDVVVVEGEWGLTKMACSLPSARRCLDACLRDRPAPRRS